MPHYHREISMFACEVIQLFEKSRIIFFTKISSDLSELALTTSLNSKTNIPNKSFVSREMILYLLKIILIHLCRHFHKQTLMP